MLFSFVHVSTDVQFHFSGAATKKSQPSQPNTGTCLSDAPSGRSLKCILFKMLVDSPINPQAINPAIACPTPHQHARNVSTHCLSPGRYSRNTVVSKTKFPPPPNPTSAIKNPSEPQLGIPPAAMAAREQTNSDTLKACRRPTTSAEIPQNTAPVSIPTYTAMVSARA